MRSRTSVTGTRKMERLRSIERVLGPLGVVLGLVGAGYAYWRSGSLWLGAFVLVMTSRFVAGSLPKIMYHDRKIHRTLFYLLWPVGGTAILWLVYSATAMMWLAVLSGLVGGALVSIFVGVIFFRDVAAQDQTREKGIGDFLIDESLEKDPEAVAMKQRFSSGDWDEIKALPELVFWMVATAGGDGKHLVGKAERKAWASAIVDDDKHADPLLRAMLLDLRIGLSLMVGTNDPFTTGTMLTSNKRFEKHSDASASTRDGFSMGRAFEMSTGDSGPHALLILENELSRDELRSFMKSLFEFGNKIALADGEASSAELTALLQLVGMVADSPQDLFTILGIEET